MAPPTSLHMICTRDQADQPRRQRRRHQAAGQQHQDIAEPHPRAAQAEHEAQGGSHGDKELRSVHRADHRARRSPPRTDQGGGGDGPPSTTTRRIHETANQAQGRQETRPVWGHAGLRDVGAAKGEAPQDEHAEPHQQQRHHGTSRLGGQVGQHRGSGKGTDGPGDPQTKHQPPVHIAQLHVRGTGGDIGAQLGQVDRGAGHGGRQPTGQQHRRRGDAVAHAERAVDQLSDEPGQGENDELLHRQSLL